MVLEQSQNIEQSQHRMTPTELRTALSLAAIYFLRMLGLFIILPVFSLHTGDFTGATPMLVGLALGVYGATQAMFQIPFGMLSDRFGRKPIITAGLLIFAIGSIIAAISTSIEGVILGRILQGAGAIASAVMAMAADLTRDEQRTKTMAIIGISIGLSFVLAFALGPVISGWIGLSGLFWIAALLAMGALIILHMAVPEVPHGTHSQERKTQLGQLSTVLKDNSLLRLNIGIFVLHAILTASFVVIPLSLRDYAGLAAADHWKVYLPVLLASVLMIPAAIGLADRQGRSKEVFTCAVALLAAAELCLYFWHHRYVSLVPCLAAFFVAFNYLEASLPALVSRTAPKAYKGTALGVYSTCQFLGIFLGGIGGGWCFERYGLNSVYLLSSVAALAWLTTTVSMSFPAKTAGQIAGSNERAN